RGFAPVDPRDVSIEEARSQEAIEIDSDPIRIGDEAIAYAEGALGRFDETVDVIEALRLAHPQALVEREDDQGRQALRRRRCVVERADAEPDAERLSDNRLVILEIGACDR